MSKTAARILVVDDDARLRDLVKQALLRQDYAVETAQDGEMALQHIERDSYQLILCDILMPKIGGMEILDHVWRKGADTEVVMMTGVATLEMAVQAMQKGAYDFLQKPFALDKLMMIVEKSLEKSQMRRTLLELHETKKRLEESQRQLIQAERLAGIGQLAGGVAHELNNPLSGILGLTQLMVENPSLPEDLREDITMINGLGRRCKTIIENLLQFSRRRAAKQDVVDIVQALQATINIINYEMSVSGIELVLHVDRQIPPVFGDVQQLQQVFLNLMTNARQAMEQVSERRLEIEVKTEEDKVLIRFTDNGKGMTPEEKDKIFDPFFTTRPVGQGTGLGLSLSLGIVEQHHGRMRVESRPSEGTTITVELPAYAGVEAAGNVG